jgi:hypothetical protein
MDEYVAGAIPLGRWGTPEDVGHMVTFLAGPAAGWITERSSWWTGDPGSPAAVRERPALVALTAPVGVSQTI